MRVILVLKRLSGVMRLMKYIFTRKGVILNYQMGKVGSSSIGEWFRQNDVAEWHIHRFFDTPVHSNRRKNRALKAMDLLLFRVLRLSQKKIKIVTGVRYPLERDISMYFHIAYGLEARVLPEFGNVGEVSDDFDMSFPVLACVNWFDDELKKLTGVDLFDYPFDKEKGFAVIDSGKYQFFVYRLDKLDSLQGELSRFFEKPDFRLINMNQSGSKRYMELYQEFRREYYRNTTSTYAAEERFLGHFYGDRLINQYKLRWMARD